MRDRLTAMTFAPFTVLVLPLQRILNVVPRPILNIRSPDVREPARMALARGR